MSEVAIADYEGIKANSLLESRVGELNVLASKEQNKLVKTGARQSS